MTTILDAGGVSSLARNQERLRQMRERGEWPPTVPSVVLTEALTGDHHHDFHENRLLKLCQVRSVDEVLARHAALLRTAAALKGISATDAIVVASADRPGGAVVLTSDPSDLRALATHTSNPVTVART